MQLNNVYLQIGQIGWQSIKNCEPVVQTDLGNMFLLQEQGSFSSYRSVNFQEEQTISRVSRFPVFQIF